MRRESINHHIEKNILRIHNNPTQKEKFLKIISKSWHVFSHHRTRRQTTTIHHESTINAPQNTTPKNTLFPEPPSKTPTKAQKKPRQRPGLFFFANFQN
jgi:hypothetical protein